MEEVIKKKGKENSSALHYIQDIDKKVSSRTEQRKNKI